MTSPSEAGRNELKQLRDENDEWIAAAGKLEDENEQLRAEIRRLRDANGKLWDEIERLRKGLEYCPVCGVHRSIDCTCQDVEGT